MLSLRILMIVLVVVATIKGTISLQAQSVVAANDTDSISIHISLQKGSYFVGEKPTAVLNIKNVSSSGICFSTATYLLRIHITNQNGEPQKTELHRHMLGDFRAGDGPGLRSDSICQDIAPGSVGSLKYDLSAFYDLSKLGDYSIYLEIYDPAGPKDGSGRWLRTNTVKFEIKASS